MKKALTNILKNIEKTIDLFAKAIKRSAMHAKNYFSSLKTHKTAKQAKSVSQATRISNTYKEGGRTQVKRAGTPVRKQNKRIGALGSLLQHIPPTILIAASIVVVLAFAVLAFGKGTEKDGKEVMAQGIIATQTEPVLSSSPEPSSTPPLDPVTTTLKQGMSAPVVVDIQQRLMDLNYMDDSEPTQLYGPITKQAIELFQRQEGLTVDGCVGATTYSMLISTDAPKYTVSVGAQGTDVKELETRLYELGYLDAASDKFTADTKTAVQKFQQLNGLAVDGAIGQNTMEMLYSDDVKPNIYMSGDQSKKILTYQQRLQALGYLTTAPDGSYGADTINAIKRFQDLNGLIVDGYLGPQTISVLNSKNAQSNALTLGMNGNDVSRVQQRLGALNYMSGVTGYFGSGTENAVKAFQKQNGLKADGKVGAQTLNAIMSTKAKAASKTSTSPSKSNPVTTSPDLSGVERFISVAQSKLGCKYVRGAKGPNSFDCSGFVYWCLNHAGVVQSYMTSAGWQKCTKYQRISSMNALQRGDVISFKGHVGIYMGNGQMINALDGVEISKNIQASAYWTSHFVCGFRIF